MRPDASQAFLVVPAAAAAAAAAQHQHGMLHHAAASPPTSDYEEQPISRTYQYRKVMKPMLERKRRARINRCLDELKELMVVALQAEGENVSKLEKADILELTVRHLHKLRRHHALALTPELAYADRFRAGFTRCAAEVSQYLAGAATAAETEGSGSAPGAGETGAALLRHLAACVRHLEQRGGGGSPPPPLPVHQPANTPPPSPPPPPPVTQQHHHQQQPSPVETPVLTARTTSVPLTHDKLESMDITEEEVEDAQASSVWRPW
ncbi:enhancer of split mbeta protein-like [Schistocerca americana]|uniref:enhancer of split mbeta protein-like n=1 Tax=Schistocerca americana TaxID=7009 RepID=UPI001F4F4EFF|nr:enhancer of split mbeta protein-like [Schistocerca americana]